MTVARPAVLVHPRVPSSDGRGIIDFLHEVDGSGAAYLNMPAGGSARPASHETVDARLHYVRQDGAHVFKYAVRKFADVSLRLLERNGLQASDVDLFVAHQANTRIIDAAQERLGLPADRVVKNIDRYGNTTAATIPLCLWEWEDKLKKGDTLILAAFGGGFTWGAVYVKWAY